MFFYVDVATQKVSAFKKLSEAARFGLSIIGEQCPAGCDPVKLANEKLKDNGLLLNISGAFESIAESEGPAAQELANDFKAAIDNYYKVKK